VIFFTPPTPGRSRLGSPAGFMFNERSADSEARGGATFA
jgi:hypothetical protein